HLTSQSKNCFIGPEGAEGDQFAGADMWESRMKRIGILAALAATTFFAASAFAAEPIVLGWVVPLSAPGNFSGGPEMRSAVHLEVDQINEAGGLLGRPLKVVYEDTKGQPVEGSAA